MDIPPGATRCVGQNLDEEDEATFTLQYEELQPHHRKLPKVGAIDKVNLTLTPTSNRTLTLTFIPPPP